MKRKKPYRTHLNSIIWYWGLFSFFIIQGCAILSAGKEFQEGTNLFKQKRYVEAHEYAKRACELSGNDSKYLGLLGWTYLKQGELEQAEKIFSSLLAKETNSAAAEQGLAWLAYTNANFTDAEQWFEKALKWAIKHTKHKYWKQYPIGFSQHVTSIASDAHYGMGLAAIGKKDFKDAISHLKQSLDYKNFSIGHGPVKQSLGDAYHALQNYPKAVEYYHLALEEGEPPSPVAVKLAWSLYYGGMVSESKKILIKYSSQIQDRLALLYIKVFISQAQGRYSEANVFLLEMIETNPGYADTYAVHNYIKAQPNRAINLITFARAYFNKGMFNLAYKKLNGYSVSYDKDCKIRIMEAWCLLHTNRLLMAATAFESLGKRDECSDLQTRIGSGVTLLYLGELDKADKIFSGIQRQYPENIRGGVARGAVAYLSKDYEKAIEIYRSYLDFLPRTEGYFGWPSHALNNLGWAYIYTGEFGKALETFKKLENYHRANPIYPAVFAGMGWAYYYLKNLKDAEKMFNSALGLAPSEPSALAGQKQIKIDREL